MIIKLKSKIHNAAITQCDINYEGSITIDSALMKKAGIYPYEKVLVTNMDRATRFETYAIPGKDSSGIIGLNGAAAHLGKPGDKVTIMAFTIVPEKRALKTKPRILILGVKNKIIKMR